MTADKNKTADKFLDDALELLYGQKPSEALPLLKKAVELAPEDAKILSTLGLCYFILNDKINAIKCYKKAMSKRPDDANNYYYLARLYTDIGKNVEAMSVLSNGIYHCRENLKKNPNGENYLVLSRLYALNAKHNESILTLFKAVKLMPENPEVYRLLAEQYFNIQLYRECVIEAEKAIKLDPEDYNAYLYAGLSLHKLNVIDKALYNFAKSLKINPNQPELKSLHDKLIELKVQNGLTVEEVIYNARREDKRHRGYVKWFNDENGIGSIIKMPEQQEIFAHYLAIDSDGYQSLYEGDEVEFSISNSPSGPVATRVKVTAMKTNRIKTGKVKWFDEERGVGEIILKNGDPVTFHYTAIIKNGPKIIAGGAAVTCELFDTENGQQAFNVKEVSIAAGRQIEDKNNSKYTGTVKWVDFNKNMGIIEEISSAFQAIFKISDIEESENINKCSLKPGLKVSFDIQNVESLESENVKKAVNITEAENV